ncbi:unnamed protein product, partial [Chrysoparadoxa australica]
MGAAIKLLTKYVQELSADADAWLALAHLHMDIDNLDEAAFCYEEVVMAAPTNSHHHCRLAELYYSMGSSANLLKARKHFCQSASLKRLSPRALLGLSMTCAA